MKKVRTLDWRSANHKLCYDSEKEILTLNEEWDVDGVAKNMQIIFWIDKKSGEMHAYFVSDGVKTLSKFSRL